MMTHYFIVIACSNTHVTVNLYWPNYFKYFLPLFSPSKKGRNLLYYAGLYLRVSNMFYTDSNQIFLLFLKQIYVTTFEKTLFNRCLTFIRMGLN